MSKAVEVRMDNAELNACPVCGTTPCLISWYIRGVANRRHYAVKCPNCCYRLTNPYQFATIAKAIKFWNEDTKNKESKK